MPYVVKADSSRKIDLAPKTTREEILQNVAMILCTPQFSVPLDRGFGLAQRFLDLPVQSAKAVLISEVLQAIGQNEPRTKVLSVDFENTEIAGKLIPVVEVEILDGANEKLPGH